MDGHIGRHWKRGAPKIKYDWSQGDKEAVTNKKVLLVSGKTSERGLFDAEGGTRTIVGCFDKGWWGVPKSSAQVGYGPKVGAGYLKKEDKQVVGKYNGKLGKNACSNGTYESSGNADEMKRHMENIEQRYREGDNTNNEWEVRYFEDLAWILS